MAEGIMWQLVSGIDPLGQFAQGMDDRVKRQTLLEQIAGQKEDRQFNRQKDARDFQFKQGESAADRAHREKLFALSQSNIAADNARANAALELQRKAFERGEIPTGFERDPNNPAALRFKPGGPTDPAYVQSLTEVKAKPHTLSAGDITKLSEEGGKFQNLRDYGRTFEDRFAGRLPGTGDFQMTAGRIAPALAGKDNAEGASWWQSYDRYKNQVRNDLFGSALTPNEQAAFERADITPTMAPAQIRKNLSEQQRLVAAATQRKASALIAGNYDPRQVAAAYGMRPEELGVDPSIARNPAAQNALRGPQAGMPNAPAAGIPSGVLAPGQSTTINGVTIRRID